MRLRSCIALVFGGGLGCFAVACVAVGTVGHAVAEDAADDTSTSATIDDELPDEATTIDTSSSGPDNTKPATTDDDPTTDSGHMSSGGDDTTGEDDASEGESTGDEFGKLGADLGTDTVPAGCCAPTEEAGCIDATIEACVCALDSYCCEEAWDESCVNTAQLSGCSPCAGEKLPQMDCCTSNMVEGCVDVDVQDCVCATDPYCCAQAWDQTCVDMVDMLGCGVCVMG